MGGHKPSGMTGCGKTHRRCHAERSEESLYLLENSNTGILRFAQDDSGGLRMTAAESFSVTYITFRYPHGIILILYSTLFTL
jgi:hypothetical protein